MINLQKGNTETVYFTGYEKATISNPYFLFVFTNRTTNDVVKVMAANTSTTRRYDKFSLTVNTYFSQKECGTWDYEVREKASSSDMTISGTIVETGYMNLIPETAFEPTEYTEQSTDFKVYKRE